MQESADRNAKHYTVVVDFTGSGSPQICEIFGKLIQEYIKHSTDFKKTQTKPKTEHFGTQMSFGR